MLTHHVPARLVMTLLILLLCFMSFARGGALVESRLHHVHGAITTVDSRYCEMLDHCLMVDHHHLEMSEMSETTHFFLHAIEAMEGKMMVGLLSLGVTFLSVLPQSFTALPWVDPLRGSLFRPPR